jgi:hypothetical protein
VYIAHQITSESLLTIGKILGYCHINSIGAGYRRAEKTLEKKRTAKEVNNFIQTILNSLR